MSLFAFNYYFTRRGCIYQQRSLCSLRMTRSGNEMKIMRARYIRRGLLFHIQCVCIAICAHCKLYKYPDACAETSGHTRVMLIWSTQFSRYIFIKCSATVDKMQMHDIHFYVAISCSWLSFIIVTKIYYLEFWKEIIYWWSLIIAVSFMNILVCMATFISDNNFILNQKQIVITVQHND